MKKPNKKARMPTGNPAQQSHRVPILGQQKLKVAIEIIGIGIFDPQEDITPQESANIALWLFCLQMQLLSKAPYQLTEFIEEKGLERHFTPREEPAANDKIN